MKHAFECMPSQLGFLLSAVPGWFSKSDLRRKKYKALAEEFKEIESEENISEDSDNCRVTEIAADFTLKHLKMSTLIDDIMHRDIEQLREKNRDLEAQVIEKESYDKRLNILIHGIDEEVNEQNFQTRQKFEDLLNNTLEIDSKSIPIVDLHRLPEFSTQKNYKHRTSRPIIVKLQTAFDKRLIFSQLGKLKNLTNNTKESHPVFLTNHLPKLHYKQKKSLMEKFKAAKRAEERVRWGVSEGECCLYVNNVKYRPH